MSVNVKTRAANSGRNFNSFLAEFVVGSLAFTLGHGLFLGVILMMIAQAPPKPDEFRIGTLGVVAFLIFDFASDLIDLKQRPFAWLKQIAEVALGRIVLVHLAIIGGVFFATINQGGETFFLPFMFLKLLTDLASIRGPIDPSKPVPRWLVAATNRLKPGQDFGAYMATEQAKALERAAKDEEVMPRERPRESG